MTETRLERDGQSEWPPCGFDARDSFDRPRAIQTSKADRLDAELEAYLETP